MKGWIWINEIHLDQFLTKLRRIRVLEMTHWFWQEEWTWQVWTSQPTRATTLSKIWNYSSIAPLDWIHPAMKARTGWCSDPGSGRYFRHPMISALTCLRVPCLGGRRQTLRRRISMQSRQASRSILSLSEMIIYLQITGLKKARGLLNIDQTLKFKMHNSQTIMEELFIKNT